MAVEIQSVTTDVVNTEPKVEGLLSDGHNGANITSILKESQRSSSICSNCGQGMQRINPEPESWIRWTPLYWCKPCHQFGFGPSVKNNSNGHH